MLIGAEALTVADDAFAPWQMHSAVGATHHILAADILWRLFPLDPPAIAFDEAVYNPGSQGKKYQFDQHYPASGNEAPQLSRLKMNTRGEVAFYVMIGDLPILLSKRNFPQGWKLHLYGLYGCFTRGTILSSCVRTSLSALSNFMVNVFCTIAAKATKSWRG